MSSRRGVSLMEVLVSIGVVAIGLMGVATLIPLAFHQAETGARNERKASLSQRAFREFHVLGLANPSHWVNPESLMTGSDPRVPQIRQDGIRHAFCIDPRWTAMNAFVPDTQQYKPGGPDWWFSLPAVPMNFNLVDHMVGTTAPAVMPRISLRPAPGQLAMMSSAHANEVFIAQDDLEFELPKEHTLPPVQTSLSTAGQPVKRYAEGGFSWFATVVPEDGISDLYKLSIAVGHQRNMEWKRSDGTIDQSAVENSFLVKRNYDSLATNSNEGDMRGVGFAGGDITVDISQSGALNIEPGEYVMLSRHIAETWPNNPGIPRYRQRFQWYRVIAMENDLANKSANLTLDGADWDFKPTRNFPVPNQMTYMIHVPGVISVFEKTIRLEQSSLWTN